MAKRSIHDDDLGDELDDVDLDDEGLLADGFSKQVWVFIVAVVVFLAAVLGVLIYYNVGEGNTTGVTLTPPSRSGDLFTFAYSIQTDRGLATGPAQFYVTTGGVTTYSRTFEVNPGGGSLQLRATDFIIGNGEYTFRLQYKGFEGRSNFTVGTPDYTNFVVTSIRVDTSLYYPDDLRIGALRIAVNFFSDQSTSTYANAPENTSIAVRITKNGVQDGPVSTFRVDGLPYKSFNVTPALGGGNYTVNVTFTNNWIRTDSAYQTLYDQNRTFVHNKPLACISQQQYQANAANGYTVTFDGSCSTDDFGITQFTWYPGFGDPITNGSSPFETVTYPSFPQPRDYDCVLTVYDTGVPGIPYSDQFWEVTFRVHVSLT